jgi:hypothetical protein
MRLFDEVSDYEAFEEIVDAIAETLKEVYLDLRSSNDKALQRNRDDKRTGSQTTYVFGDGGNRL